MTNKQSNKLCRDRAAGSGFLESWDWWHRTELRALTRRKMKRQPLFFHHHQSPCVQSWLQSFHPNLSDPRFHVWGKRRYLHFVLFYLHFPLQIPQGRHASHNDSIMVSVGRLGICRVRVSPCIFFGVWRWACCYTQVIIQRVTYAGGPKSYRLSCPSRRICPCTSYRTRKCTRQSPICLHPQIDWRHSCNTSRYQLRQPRNSPYPTCLPM